MKSLLPNPYLLAAGVALLSFLMIYGLKRLLTTKWCNGRQKNKWDEIVVHTAEHTTLIYMLGSSLYIALGYVPHRPFVGRYFDKTYFILTMVQVAIWMNFLVEQWIITTINRKTRQNRAAASSISLLKLLAKLILFSIIFLFTLNNLNIKITTILAGLGVGGIAVALALQKILNDVFSSLSIVLDKPFMVGDFIITDLYLGEVEKIGLRTTHIRSLGGEQIIISNSDLLAARIRNMKRMHERRVAFVLSLGLEVPPEGIEKAISIINAIICSKDRVRYDRVHLMAITRTSFDLEVVYFYLHDDYNLHMDMQQEILLEIYRAFRQEKLHFAYPAQILHHMPTEIRMSQPLPEGGTETQKHRSLS